MKITLKQEGDCVVVYNEKVVYYQAREMETTVRMETTVSNHVVIDRISWYKLLQYRKEVCRILGVCLLSFLLDNW